VTYHQSTWDDAFAALASLRDQVGDDDRRASDAIADLIQAARAAEREVRSAWVEHNHNHERERAAHLALLTALATTTARLRAAKLALLATLATINEPAATDAA